MKTIKLKKEELRYLKSAIDFYCDETTHPKPDGNDGPGLPDSKESRILDEVRRKLRE